MYLIPIILFLKSLTLPWADLITNDDFRLFTAQVDLNSINNIVHLYLDGVFEPYEFHVLDTVSLCICIFNNLLKQETFKLFKT